MSFTMCGGIKVLVPLRVAVNVCLKEVLGDEMVLYPGALLVPFGPTAVWKRAEEKRCLPQTQTV